MAITIGGQNIITIGGNLTPGGEMVEAITRPGVDFAEYRKGGKRGVRSTLRPCIDYDNNSARESGVAAFVAMKGTLITVVDDVGNTFNNVMVLDVQAVTRRNLTAATGGTTAGAFWLELQLDVETTA